MLNENSEEGQPSLSLLTTFKWEANIMSPTSPEDSKNDPRLAYLIRGLCLSILNCTSLMMMQEVFPGKCLLNVLTNSRHNYNCCMTHMGKKASFIHAVM